MSYAINAAVDGRRTTDRITWARLCKITLATSQILRFTDHNTTLEFDEAEDGELQTYTPVDAPSWESTRQEHGVGVGSASLNGVVRTGGAVDVLDLRAGVWDRARCDVWTVDWKFPWLPGHLEHEVYWMGDIERSGETWSPELHTILGELDRLTGEIYSRECQTDLGSSACGVNLTPLTVAGSVTGVAGLASPHPRQRFATSLTEADNFWKNGRLTWTGGDNAIAGKQVYDIRVYKNTSGYVELWTETPFDIGIGDTFSVKPGCGKKLKHDCNGTYSNAANFRGRGPWMPTIRKTLKVPNAH